MPPTGQPTIDFSNISDEDLSQMLKDYGVSVGPINAATRKTYERRLVQLKTGKLPPSSQTPVDDDDEEVQVRQPEPQRRQTSNLSDSTQSYASSLRDSNYSSSSSKSYVSSVRDSDFSASRSFPYSERHTDLSPDVRSRSSLPADRRTPSSYAPSSLYSTPVKGPTATKVSKEKGIPLWLKLVAVAIVVILIYLIYINMEPAAVNNIPEIQNKMEV
ncbi:unnamed protein product [Candidula unifasciata]|uniref:LEM domain-containing protein n=1 Tax=Candidula unifasciata TaxID=100452 RepID=A0A8S3ZUK4_9EUPU|nr:unnamed protein product [Candidula unifasciata]